MSLPASRVFKRLDRLPKPPNPRPNPGNEKVSLSPKNKRKGNMKNELTPQILAMYLGQKCDIKWTHTDPLDGAFKTGDVWHDSTIHGAHIIRLERGEAEITPHLRRLDSLTESEARELYEIAGFKTMGNELWNIVNNPNVSAETSIRELLIGSPAAWLKLLEWGIDILGGIEAGWAKEIQNTNTP